MNYFIIDLRRAQQLLKSEIREVFVRNGIVENFRCGLHEVLRIEYAAHMATATLNEGRHIILAGLRLRCKHYNPRA